MPPIRDNRTPEIEIASPPHNNGSMLPIVEPTKRPSQTNFFAMITPPDAKQITVTWPRAERQSKSHAGVSRLYESGHVLNFFHAAKNLWRQTTRDTAAEETGRIVEKNSS